VGEREGFGFVVALYLFEKGPFVAVIPVKLVLEGINRGTGIQNLKDTGFLLPQE